MSLQLEAFEAPIKGHRIRWIITPDSPITYPPGFQEQIFTESPPFQRRILIISHQSSEAWKVVDKWDAVFVPQSPVDWSIIIAYIQNTVKPCIICIAPDVQTPLAFYQKSAPLLPTIVSFATIPVQQAPITFEATFFPPAGSLEPYTDTITTLLSSLLPQEVLRSFILKEAIRDLRSAGATLVVSSIEESKPSLYWYYVSESHVKERKLLDTVIQTLLRRGP
jgi:hypothetical protein